MRQNRTNQTKKERNHYHHHEQQQENKPPKIQKYYCQAWNLPLAVLLWTEKDSIGDMRKLIFFSCQFLPIKESFPGISILKSSKINVFYIFLVLIHAFPNSNFLSLLPSHYCLNFSTHQYKHLSLLTHKFAFLSSQEQMWDISLSVDSLRKFRGSKRNIGGYCHFSGSPFRTRWQCCIAEVPTHTEFRKQNSQAGMVMFNSFWSHPHNSRSCKQLLGEKNHH